MELKVLRQWFDDNCTIGELFIDGVWECFTLEDAVRPAGEKIHGQTAIPAGRYAVAITMSARFKRMMPLLIDVPNFSGVRIHSGNTDKDTEGCILVGEVRENDRILQSRNAFNKLFPKIDAAIEAGEEVYIEVVGGKS